MLQDHFSNLSQCSDKCRGLRVCQLQQFVMECDGDEAFQGGPEVVGVSAEPLHQPPAQSHSLHTKQFIMEQKLQHHSRNFMRLSGLKMAAITAD